MNAKTLKALKGSIVKWEGIRVGKTVEKGTVNCLNISSLRKNKGEH